MNETDALLWIGGEVKALGNGKVGGYLVRFTGPDDPDLHGDFFTSQTDFFLDGGEGKAAILYHHGLDPVLKARKIGRGTLKTDKVGIWIEGELNVADSYDAAIYSMCKSGKLKWSSSSVNRLIEREKVGSASKINRWPIVEASLTPAPAEPRNAAFELKSLAQPAAVEWDTFFEAVDKTIPGAELTFQQHSETVGTAVQGFAKNALELGEQLKGFTDRTRRRLEFRELKDGRSISAASKDNLRDMKNSLLGAKDATAQQILDAATAIDELLATAEKKDEGKLQPEEVEEAALLEAAKFEELQFSLATAPRRTSDVSRNQYLGET